MLSPGAGRTTHYTLEIMTPEQIIVWLFRHAVFLFALFCISVGIAFSLVTNPIVQRTSHIGWFISRLTAFLLVSIPVYYALYDLNLDKAAVWLGSLFLGIMADYILVLTVKSLADAKDLPGLIGRFWRVWNALKNEEPPTSTDD
jgi:hypothetical protein